MEPGDYETSLVYDDIPPDLLLRNLITPLVGFHTLAIFFASVALLPWRIESILIVVGSLYLFSALNYHFKTVSDFRYWKDLIRIRSRSMSVKLEVADLSEILPYRYYKVLEEQTESIFRVSPVQVLQPKDGASLKLQSGHAAYPFFLAPSVVFMNLRASDAEGYHKLCIFHEIGHASFAQQFLEIFPRQIFSFLFAIAAAMVVVSESWYPALILICAAILTATLLRLLINALDMSERCADQFAIGAFFFAAVIHGDDGHIPKKQDFSVPLRQFATLLRYQKNSSKRLASFHRSVKRVTGSNLEDLESDPDGLPSITDETDPEFFMQRQARYLSYFALISAIPICVSIYFVGYFELDALDPFDSLLFAVSGFGFYLILPLLRAVFLQDLNFVVDRFVTKDLTISPWVENKFMDSAIDFMGMDYDEFERLGIDGDEAGSKLPITARVIFWLGDAYFYIIRFFSTVRRLGQVRRMMRRNGRRRF